MVGFTTSAALIDADGTTRSANSGSMQWAPRLVQSQQTEAFPSVGFGCPSATSIDGDRGM